MVFVREQDVLDAAQDYQELLDSEVRYETFDPQLDFDGNEWDDESFDDDFDDRFIHLIAAHSEINKAYGVFHPD